MPVILLSRIKIRTLSSLCLIVVLFASSCKKDALTNTNTDSSVKVSTVNVKPSQLAVITSASAGVGAFVASPTLNLNGKHNITISGLTIDAKGSNITCLKLANCDHVYIVDCKFINSKNTGIELYNCSNVTINHCYINNVSTGVYAVNCPLGQIKVVNNQMVDMKGPYPRGQATQFNGVCGPGNWISFNRCENHPGSNPEDVINLYRSNGVANDPIRVESNMIRCTNGCISNTGGGILLGDNGGNYQIAQNNILVNPGQYGMGIAGGDHNCLMNNKIYACASGNAVANVGVVNWGQAGFPCSNENITGNLVNFSGKWGQNNYYLGPKEATPTGWSTNTWTAPINASILPAVLTN